MQLVCQGRTWCTYLVVLAFCVVLLSVCEATAIYQTPTKSTTVTSAPCPHHFQNVGPFHVANSYEGVNTLDNPEDIGAVHEFWYPGAGETAYLAGVNGGVWKTTTFHSTSSAFGGPHWTPTSDYMPCLQIGGLSGSSSSADFLVAGCGARSNGAQRGGEAAGVMLSTDGAASWKMAVGFPKGYQISSVLVSGLATGTHRIVVASHRPLIEVSGTTGSGINSYQIPVIDDYGQPGGIWTSSDLGQTWTMTWTNSTTKLLRHPLTPTTIFALGLETSAAKTIYTMKPIIKKSTNEGTSWADLPSLPNVGGVCTASGSALSNVIGSLNAVNGVTTFYIGFYVTLASNDAESCYAFFYSNDSTSELGTSWTQITGVPAVGSGLDLGPQGDTNFALLADPGNANYIYIAATERLVFRVDIRTMFWQLISSPDIVPISDAPAGIYTASKTAPHADARNLYWDASVNELLVTNDGGLYRRTHPRDNATRGDWFSLAGDLAITECYAALVDDATGAIILSSQDNSLMISQYDGTENVTGVWGYALTGDGTSISIDTGTTPSTLYGADQYLGGFFSVPVGEGLGHQTFFTGAPVSNCDFSGSDKACWLFRTPIAVNSQDPNKILLASRSTGACYSVVFATGASTELEFTTSVHVPSAMISGQVADPIQQYVFGGRRAGVTYAYVVLACAESYCWCRTTPSASNNVAVGDFTGSVLPSNGENYVNTNTPWMTTVQFSLLIQHPIDFYMNILIDDAGHAHLTTNFGKSWTDITLPSKSNLLAVSGHTTVDTMGTGSAIFVQTWINGGLPLIVATTYGLWVTFTPLHSNQAPDYLTFVPFSAGVPHAIVNSMVYSYATDTLTVATFGRGVWQLQGVSASLQDAFNGVDTSTRTSSCLVPAYPNVPGAYGYSSSAAGVSPVLTSTTIRPPFNETLFSTIGTGGEAGTPTLPPIGAPSSSTGASGTSSSTANSGSPPDDSVATIGISFSLHYPCASLVNTKARIETDLFNALTNVRSSQITYTGYICTSSSETLINVQFSYYSNLYKTPSEMLAELKSQASKDTSSLYYGTYTQYFIAGSVTQTSGPVCITCAASVTGVQLVFTIGMVAVVGIVLQQQVLGLL